MRRRLGEVETAFPYPPVEVKMKVEMSGFQAREKKHVVDITNRVP